MKALLKIQNLKCGGCANTITAKLEAIEAVSKVKVDVEDCEVGFEYTTDLVLAKAKATLKAIGYPEDGEANSIGTKAKSYVSCAIGKLG